MGTPADAATPPRPRPTAASGRARHRRQRIGPAEGAHGLLEGERGGDVPHVTHQHRQPQQPREVRGANSVSSSFTMLQVTRSSTPNPISTRLAKSMLVACAQGTSPRRRTSPALPNSSVRRPPKRSAAIPTTSASRRRRRQTRPQGRHRRGVRPKSCCNSSKIVRESPSAENRPGRRSPDWPPARRLGRPGRAASTPARRG